MTDKMPENECRYFKKYKAIHRPRCKCLACRDKYIDHHDDRYRALEEENKRLREVLEAVVISNVPTMYREMAKQALETIELPPDKFKELTDRLDEPPKENPKLKKLMSEPSILEKSDE